MKLPNGLWEFTKAINSIFAGLLVVFSIFGFIFGVFKIGYHVGHSEGKTACYSVMKKRK